MNAKSLARALRRIAAGKRLSSLDVPVLEDAADSLEASADLFAACKALFARPTDPAVDVNRDYTDADAALDKIRAALDTADDTNGGK